MSGSASRASHTDSATSPASRAPAASSTSRRAVERSTSENVSRGGRGPITSCLRFLFFLSPGTAMGYRAASMAAQGAGQNTSRVRGKEAGDDTDPAHGMATVEIPSEGTGQRSGQSQCRQPRSPLSWATIAAISSAMARSAASRASEAAAATAPTTAGRGRPRRRGADRRSSSRARASRSARTRARDGADEPERSSTGPRRSRRCMRAASSQHVQED